MNRHLFVALLLLGLLVTMVGAANAITTVPSWPHQWPNWSEVTGSFSASVSKVQTSTGWDYTVTVDPNNAYPGWGIQAFVVYANAIPTQKFNGWGEYDGRSPAGWTHNGGWELDKYPGPAGSTAAFGWVTWNGPSAYVYSGNTATFHAINLPQGFQDWGQKFAVLVQPATSGVEASCDDGYWAPATDDGGGPPQETPEPGSLALLTLGAGAVLGTLKRRRLS